MGILIRAITKLIATFAVAVGLFALSFMYFPQGIEWVNMAAQFMGGAIGNPTFLGEDAAALFTTYVTDSTLLGVIVTAIARVLIEAVSFLFGGMLGDR